MLSRIVVAAAMLVMSAPSPAAAVVPGTGSITGRLTYPSEYIPPLRIYAISVEDDISFYAVSTEIDQKRFLIQGIAPGRYVVVAYPEEEELSEWVGGWASRDELVTVTVAAGATAADVVINEWVVEPAEGFPLEPPPTPGTGVAARSCLARKSQMDVNACNRQAHEIADRALNAEYQRIMALVNLHQTCREGLRAAQRTWITFRDAHCDYEGAALYAGRGIECLKEMTIQRTEYLKVQDEHLCARW